MGTHQVSGSLYQSKRAQHLIQLPGEIGAAYAAGLISARDAIITAYLRGKIAGLNRADGLMLAVGLGSEAVSKHLKSIHSDATIACFNSPENVTLSGLAPDIRAAKDLFDQMKIFTRVLSTGGNAYHSPHMLALGQHYQHSILENRDSKDKTTISLPRIPLFSSVTGLQVSPDDIDPRYWKQNLESPVQFERAAVSMVEASDIHALVEIGPHSALRSSIHQIAHSMCEHEFPQYFPTLIRGEDCVSSLMNTAGSLWAYGYPVRTQEVNSTEGLGHNLECGTSTRKRKIIVNLPRYQWQYEKSLLLENRWTREWRLRRHARHDIIGSMAPGNDRRSILWRNVLRHQDLEWLGHHRVGYF